ncbi:eCIS core domain-containing protein [Amycolatopsis tolypomycina]|uniref:eCIS core domain-containing protein n=1 Tax=Amycolatopsis tolypomycina TaxID=208445 RepID=UPI00339E6FE3
MRGQTHDNDLDPNLRPKGDRIERDDHDLLGRAAAAGRTDVLGPAGLLGLQRAVGNAGTSSLVEEERSPVHDVVGSGGGAPLDTATREDMEGRFGADFSDVRVHTDSAAHDSAKSVNAQAYTVGSNIVFQRDKYDPGSDSGKHMLAHELTHVVQQRSGPVDGTDTGGGVKVSDPSDRFEREAVANADRLMSTPAPAAAGPAVQRCEDGGHEEPVQRMTVQREEEAPPAEEGEEEKMAQTFVQREEETEEEA